MKKLLLVSLLGMLGIGETMAQCTTTVSTFPHIEDFSSATAGAPGTLPTGWAITPATGFRFEIEVDQPSSGTGSGPAADHTTGVAGAGKYVYTESSSGVTGDIANLNTPCFNLAGLTSPGFDFWYHMHGATTGTMEAQVSTNNGTTWTTVATITGPQQTAATDPWLKRTVSLAGFTGTVQIRFKGTRGSSFTGDMAIDDFKIYNIPPIDAEIVAITAPAASSGCAFTATENVTISIKNNGIAAITSIPVRYVLNTTTVNETAAVNIAPGATGTYTFTAKANLTTPATYTLTATALLPSDGDPSNNVKSRTIISVPNVSTFPYNQNFDTGAGGWVAGGTASTWALGTPAGTVINTAASGTNSWKTTLAGTYNSNEQSAVVGPCFNFSTLVQPIISMKIWWNMEANYDKAALQSSIDGGATWQHVGVFGDPDNWYNNNSTSGPGVGGGVKEGWSGRTSSTNGSNGWVLAKHKLTGLGGQSSVLLRVAFGSDGSGVDDGFAFDDISIFESPANDVALFGITSPAVSGCGFTATENVCITIKNLGSTPTSTIPVSYKIGTNPTVNETANLVIAPGATATYCFTTKANLSAVGTYNFTFTTALANDGDPSNNSATRTVTVIPTIATFPYTQNFDTGAGGWVAGGTSSSWALGTPAGTVINTAASGTNSWKTTLAGTYNSNEQSAVVGPCFNFSTLVQPIISMKIWWNTEANYDKAALQSSIDGGATWQHVGTFGDPDNWYNNNSTNGPGVGGGIKIGWSGRTSSTNGSNGWVTAKHNLTGLGGQSSVLLRVAFGSDGSGVDDGFAFDDVSIFESPSNDVGILAITSPAISGCGFTATENVCITITNLGSTPTSTIPVSYKIGTNPTVNETANLVIAPGATATYCFTTKANLATVGTYNFTITTALPNDGNPSNNSATRTVTVIPTISTLPYSEGFENGAGGWIAGGAASTWALGTPAKPVINSAGTGTNSWITGLTNSYNNNEQSAVVGPCFNFAGKPDPDFEMKIWWNTEANYDKAALQSSIDGGLTWQHVGAFGNPNNWYNNNSTNGPGVGGGVKEGWSGRASSSNGSGGWVKAKHKLTGLGGQSSVLLRIAFGTDGSGVDDGFAFDDIRIGDNTGNLSVNSFVPLTQLCGFGSNEKVEVILENLGSTPVSGYTLSYTVNNGTSTTGPFNAPTVPTLAPGIPTNFTFPVGANLSAAGNYTIVVTVNNPTDPEPANNTVTYTIANATFAGIPPIFDFETAATGVAGLRIVTNSKSGVTEGAAASQPLFGAPATSTKGMIMDGVTDPNWLIPVGLTDPWTNNPDHFSAAYICFAPQGAANPGLPLWLSFDLKQLFKTANANTNFRVTVNGAQIGGTYRPPFNGTPIDWQKVYIDLTPFAQLSNIQVGLESSVAEPFAAGVGTANLIDNIRIQRVNPTGVNSKLLLSNISVYPNPSSGVFSVSVPGSKAYLLEVTDLTGKVIKAETVKGKTQLDLSANAKGVYLLKVTSDGNTAIQKLIVQ